MSLFIEQINNWSDWGKVYQSISAFAPLVRFILQTEGLREADIERLTPGTNAVFKVGECVIKIFAPPESGFDQTIDLQTELFAMKRAKKLGIDAPKLIASGFVEDKYRFAYMITEYIAGREFCDVITSMTDGEKRAIGVKLRQITDKMNVPCEPFNRIDVIADKERSRRWDKYSASFKAERLSYINERKLGELVFVHGDLCGDNILVKDDELYIIDFADAVLAPKNYEHALITAELFDFDPALMGGFFGDFEIDDMTNLCLDGLLIHDFGGDIITHRFGSSDRFSCLDDLKKRIRDRILRPN